MTLAEMVAQYRAENPMNAGIQPQQPAPSTQPAQVATGVMPNLPNNRLAELYRSGLFREGGYPSLSFF